MKVPDEGSISPRAWKYINSGFHPGAYNMEFDQALASALVSGEGAPALRVYGWKPHAVSLGFHQSMEEIDEKRCRDCGIDIVRRPTGGRAILHADELTYCVVMNAEGRSIQTVYAEISAALVAGLRRLGADVGFATSQPEFGKLYRSASSIPCFSSSARYEIQSNGKKLVGSAQRRYSADGDEVVLQHGSILLGPAHKFLSELIKSSDTQLAGELSAALDSKTTDLSSVLGREVPFGKAAEAVRAGFEEALGIEFEDIGGSAIDTEVEARVSIPVSQSRKVLS